LNNQKQSFVRLAAWTVAALLVAAVLLVLAGRIGPRPNPDTPAGPGSPHGRANPPLPADREENRSGPSGARTIGQIVRSAATWGPGYHRWIGRHAPDFSVTDISGKTHRLSDYRGRDVMLVFWATWCGPCRVEVPHLIALRKHFSEDRLAMLAISNENEALVERFAADAELNYPVLAVDTSKLPGPFDSVFSIPSSFFIGPDGTIKLATVGMLSLSDMKDIIEAR
jgi:peroxiredoxin